MTYIAGTEAQMVVWISTESLEQHLAAFKWPNEQTVNSFAFLAVRLRVVQLGDSEPAPIFEVVEGPNNWER